MGEWVTEEGVDRWTRLHERHETESYNRAREMDDSGSNEDQENVDEGILEKVPKEGSSDEEAAWIE